MLLGSELLQRLGSRWRRRRRKQGGVDFEAGVCVADFDVCSGLRGSAPAVVEASLCELSFLCLVCASEVDDLLL